MKSVFNLIKYNKSLLNKLDINIETIKDNYIFKYKINIIKNGIKFTSIILLGDIILFLLLLVYIILFYKKGKFNNKNLKIEYNEGYKNFIDYMDNYILITYLIIIFSEILLNIILLLCKIIALKGYIKLIFLLINFLIDLIHYSLYIFKFRYSKRILIINFYESTLVFYDVWIIFYLTSFIFTSLFFIIRKFLKHYKLDDNKSIILKQIKKIDIVDFEFPEAFENLTENIKKQLIFNKENIKKYRYKLNKKQIDLINKINDIREQNYIPSLKYSLVEQIPNFFINRKTELFFFSFKNIYKLSSHLYLFKYPKNNVKNLFKNKEILNIIKNDLLDTINIIEINNIEYICIYNNINNNIFKYNIKRYNNINNNIKIDINMTNINMPNSEDKLKYKTIQSSNSEISDKEFN